MRSDQIWDLFDWYHGACFRCEAFRVPVTGRGGHGSLSSYGTDARSVTAGEAP